MCGCASCISSADALLAMRRLANEHGLHLLYKEEFHKIFVAEREHREFKPLLQRMKVVSASGESQMDEDQWEAASTSCVRVAGDVR